MSDWQRTLDIADAWQKALDFEISYQELATRIAGALRMLKDFNDEYIDDLKVGLIDEFEYLAGEEDVDVIDFDYLMGQLYDWGDTQLDDKFGGKKVCWIKTNF